MEIIYEFLLHVFALIGLILTIIAVILARFIISDSECKKEPNEDEILCTKTDREIYDAEN